MTKAQYIKMNRGINDSSDLPEEFLSKIYDEIENEEIKLKVTTTTTTKRGAKENITTDKQRESLFHIQMKDVESIARDLMSNAGSITEEFTIAKHFEHVRPMFQVMNFPYRK
jgi:brefeldin A-inhibited guanine nucleotide-exchange protein